MSRLSLEVGKYERKPPFAQYTAIQIAMKRTLKWLAHENISLLHNLYFLAEGFGSRSRRFERNKNVSSPSTCKSKYCGEPPWPRGSEFGLRPPGLEFRILCLEDSVISIISPSSRGSPGPVQPICAQRWPKARFISFHFYFLAYRRLLIMHTGLCIHDIKIIQARSYFFGNFCKVVRFLHLLTKSPYGINHTAVYRSAKPKKYSICSIVK